MSMKTISKSFLFFSFLLIVACGQNKDQLPTDMVKIDKKNLPEIKFEEEVHDFGKITQGEKVSHNFRFTNTGKGNLIISNAYGSCGCTVPEIPKQPIPPGKGSFIRVTFDSEGKSGIVSKEISILTNCMPNKRVIKVKADIFVPQTKNP